MLRNACYRFTTYLCLAWLNAPLGGQRHLLSSVLSLWGRMTGFGCRASCFWDALYWSHGCFHGERSPSDSCHGTLLFLTLPGRPWRSSGLWPWCLTEGWRVRTLSWAPCPVGPVDRWGHCMCGSLSGLAAWQGSGAGSYLVKENWSVTQTLKDTSITLLQLFLLTTGPPTWWLAAGIQASIPIPPSHLEQVDQALESGGSSPSSFPNAMDQNLPFLKSSDFVFSK